MSNIQEINGIDIEEYNKLKEMLKAQSELLAKLQAEKASKTKRTKQVSFSVSEKGGINISGLRRFPICLYAEEMDLLKEAISNGKLDEFLASDPKNAKTGVGVTRKTVVTEEAA